MQNNNYLYGPAWIFYYLLFHIYSRQETNILSPILLFFITSEILNFVGLHFFIHLNT